MSNSKRRPYLDFYHKHSISPVANDVDWDMHFAQRKGLYYCLGITPRIVKERKVLAFGPGNEVKAIC